MIGCVSLKPYRPEGLAERLKGRLFGPLVEARSARACGVEYLLLEVSRCRDPSAAWTRIAAVLPDDLDCLLAPEEVGLPDSFSPPDIARFERALLLDTACALIAGSATAGRCVAGLFDPAGDHCGLLAPLLRCCASVQVRTNRPDCYRSAVEQLLEELGAPVQVSENTVFRDCALLLCPDGNPLPFSPLCPVLSPRQIPGRFVLSEPRIAAGGSLPVGIDPHLFAGAAFSLHPHPARPRAASVMLDGSHISLKQAQTLLEREFPTR